MNVQSALTLAATFVFVVAPTTAAQSVGGPIEPPQPKFQVRLDKSIPVAMRDGVKLSTDLFFPVGATEPLPTVLIRTPYNKNNMRDGAQVRLFTGQGYVLVIQDTRGKFESEGQFSISGGDHEDGYDTVDWIARQPWSNGKVGTYGCSYLGDVQMFQAKLRNPHLSAMIPQASGSSNGSAGGRYRQFGSRYGGNIGLASAFGWFRANGSKISYRPPPELPRSVVAQSDAYFRGGPVLPEIDLEKIWWSLPVIDMMKKAGAPPTDWETIVSVEPTGSWWDQFAYLTDKDQFDVPALFVNSWYDFGTAESIYQFGLLQRNSVSQRARDNQFIVISPTAHCRSEQATQKTVLGARDLGDARFDYWSLYLNWFDHWLKGVDNAVTAMPKVRYYLMGANEWRTADNLPIPGTVFTKYYLHSDGHANTRFGTGVLSVEPPKTEPPDQFVYDPKTPVPTVGGAFYQARGPQSGAFDQSDVEMRGDVLVYTTPPLTEGIEVTGMLEAVLYVASSAKDTDFTAKLVDVYPDGTAYNLMDGIRRARYREGYDRKVWMEEGKVYEVRIDLFAIGNYFGPGHRIRLEISSSNFPRFDRNLNTGGNNYDETVWVTAHNSVHHSARYASHLLLPVIPPGASRRAADSPP